MSQNYEELQSISKLLQKRTSENFEKRKTVTKFHTM